MSTSPDSLASRFGDLRSAAHSLTGDERWDTLTKLLDDWPQPHLQDVVLPYLQETLRDDMSRREAPKRWLALDGERLDVHPAFCLARRLTLDCYDDGDSGYDKAKHLLNSPHLNHLTSLHLIRTWIRDEGAQALTNCAHLTHLHLGYNEIFAEGAAALASSPNLCQAIRDQWS